MKKLLLIISIIAFVFVSNVQAGLNRYIIGYLCIVSGGALYMNGLTLDKKIKKSNLRYDKYFKFYGFYTGLESAWTQNYRYTYDKVWKDIIPIAIERRRICLNIVNEERESREELKQERVLSYTFSAILIVFGIIPFFKEFVKETTEPPGKVNLTFNTTGVIASYKF